MTHKFIDALESVSIVIMGGFYFFLSIMEQINLFIGILVGLATLILTIAKFLQVLYGKGENGKSLIEILREKKKKRKG